MSGFKDNPFQIEDRYAYFDQQDINEFNNITGKETMNLHDNETIDLLQDNFVYVRLELLNKHVSTMIFKCPTDWLPSIGDLFVVGFHSSTIGISSVVGGEVPKDFKIAACVEVIEPDSITGHSSDWVIQRIDLNPYHELVKQEHKIRTLLKKIDREKRKQQIKKSLVSTGNSEVDAEIKKLLAEINTNPLIGNETQSNADTDAVSMDDIAYTRQNDPDVDLSDTLSND